MSRWISAALVSAALSGLIQLVTILTAPPAWGCSCIGPMTSADHYRAADAVFTGTVVDRIPSSSRNGDPIITVLFDVARVYKGEVGSAESVVSLGGGAGGVVTSCDINFRAAEWLVYAEDRGRDGFYASLCGGTRPLPRKLPAALGTGHTPTGGPGFMAIHPDFHGTPPSQGKPPREWVVDDPVRSSLPWLFGGAVGVALLAVPGWLTLRFRRWRALAADDDEVRVWQV